MSADRLRDVIANARAAKRCITVPGCHDAMSAVLIQRAGFEIAFMSGFAVSATQLAMPDAGLISYGEMLAVGKNICDATHGKLLVIGDGDTGFGGPGNIRRTLRGYAAAGFAGISIEDQVYPKRCSYAKGLAVEPRTVALARVRAAVEAIREMRQEGLDLLLIARTDCRNAAEHGGLAEAIARCSEFAALGADMVYAEGLGGLDEMEALAKAVTVPTMLAQVERPGQALISAQEAAAAGFTLNLLGLTVLNVANIVIRTIQLLAGLAQAIFAMKSALGVLATGRHPSGETRMPFAELYVETGFDEHYQWEDRFQSKM